MAGREATEYFFATGFSPLGAGHVNASSRGQNLGSRSHERRGIVAPVRYSPHLRAYLIFGLFLPIGPAGSSATKPSTGSLTQRHKRDHGRLTLKLKASRLRATDDLSRSTTRLTAKACLDTPPTACGTVSRRGAEPRKVRVKNPKARERDCVSGFLAGHFCMNSTARTRNV